MPLPNETFVIVLRGDMDFTPCQRVATEDAISEWYEFTKGRFLFHVEYDLKKTDLDAPMNDDLIFKVNSKFCHIKTMDKQYEAKICGLCNNSSKLGTIYMVDDRLDNHMEFKTTMMHELGHYVGLDHTPEASIMYKNSNSAEKFNQLDGIEFCDKYGCELTDLCYQILKV